MRLLSKPALTVILTIILIVGGFFFLLRGCLSKYDERSALAPVLYFEKDGKEILFTIVKFEKATSYSRKGGFTSKSVSTNYFIQINDATTGKKIDNKKIRHHSDVKYHPVEIMGASGNTAWVFIGELMAFDPFTLDKIADRDILEQKNPAFKGKLPAEERYYKFNNADRNIYITAIDGSALKLDTKTILITETDTDPDLSPEENAVKQLEKQLKENDVRQDSLYQQKNYRPARQLSAREIDRNEYNRITKGFYDERTLLYKERDSLRNLQSKIQKQQRSGDELKRRVESLQRSSHSFNDLKTNQDTIEGKWYGVYTAAELEKLYNRVQYQSVYGETARRKLFIASFKPDDNGDFIIDKDNAAATSASPFLDGGLLVDKQTAMPVRLQNPASFLVVFKNQVGNDGLIQVSRVSNDGKTMWTFDTQLKNWADWVITPKYLFLLGVTNKELSSSSYNLLWVVKLSDGTASSHDYFSDK